MPSVEDARENRVRSRAARHGYRVRKSRQWKHVPNLDNFGDYMLADAETGIVVIGPRFDASLDEIEAFLTNG